MPREARTIEFPVMRGGNIVRRWERRFRSLPVYNVGHPDAECVDRMRDYERMSPGLQMLVDTYGNWLISAFTQNNCRDPMKIMDVIAQAVRGDREGARRAMYRLGIHEGFVRQVLASLPDESGGWGGK